MSTTWYKSSFSGSEATCVEIAHRADAVLIRDSKYTGLVDEQPIVSISPMLWADLLGLVLSNESGAVGNTRIAVNPDASAVITDSGATLVYDADEWDAFAKGVADGQFDRRS